MEKQSVHVGDLAVYEAQYWPEIEHDLRATGITSNMRDYVLSCCRQAYAIGARDQAKMSAQTTLALLRRGRNETNSNGEKAA